MANAGARTWAHWRLPIGVLARGAGAGVATGAGVGTVGWAATGADRLT